VTIAGPALRIACGEGAVEVLELQPAGKRRMTAGEYLRGLRTPPARAS
jgi:methionyl-tRNA formyltransferase